MAGRKRDVPVTDDQIEAAYAELHSVPKVAERLGVGEATAHRALKNRGVELTGLRDYRSTMGQPKQEPYVGVYTGSVEEIAEMHRRGMSLRAIAKAIGRSTHVVVNRLKQAGIEGRPWQASGPEHSMWSGGRLPSGNGYWRVWVPEDDPMASMRNSQGYVLEHRLVMARKLNRPLGENETVHHIDGDRGNSHPDNLQLRHGEHGAGVAPVCLDCGSHNIGFDALGVPQSINIAARIDKLEAEIARLRASRDDHPPVTAHPLLSSSRG